MKKLKIYNFICLISLLFLFCQPARINPDDDNQNDVENKMLAVQARMVNNRDYYPVVFDLFKNAENTIYLIMYSMKYYSYDPDTEQSKLLRELINAYERGVDVKVILEQSDWNSSLNEDNYASGGYLKNNGVDVRYDSKSTTTHCKTIIIDSLYVIVGSTNWSKSAINYNNEANALLMGRNIALEYMDYFNGIWINTFERN